MLLPNPGFGDRLIREQTVPEWSPNVRWNSFLKFFDVVEGFLRLEFVYEFFDVVELGVVLMRDRGCISGNLNGLVRDAADHIA